MTTLPKETDEQPLQSTTHPYFEDKGLNLISALVYAMETHSKDLPPAEVRAAVSYFLSRYPCQPR